MISVNPKFRQLITGDNPTRIRLYFLADSIDWTNDTDVTANGELLVRDAGDTDSNRRIAQNGISLLRIANKDVDYEIGCAASYTLSITFLNDDGGLNNFNFARRCKVFLDVQDTSDFTWYSCPLGVFRFEKPVKQRVQLIEATGYDLMQELNVIADDWWNSLDFSGGLTIEQIISSLSARIGFTVAYTGTLVNKALQFSSRPFDSVEVTYREIVEILAEVMGANARISAEGYLNFYEPYNQVNYTIDCDTLGNGVFSADVAEYTVSQIDKLRIMASDSDYGAIIGTGTNGYQIIDNPFLYGSSQSEIVTKATPIYNKLSSLVSYNPISVVSIADPSYEAGDRIIFVYKGTTYTMPIFQQEIAWRGGAVTIENTCTGNEKREVMTEVARSEYRGRKTVHEVEVTADTLASRINNFDGSGSTIEQTIDGINTEVSSKVGDDEIISRINQSSESVTIQANKVNLSGYVTFTNLATEGQTVINGGNITTGTIDASDVNVTNINANNITSGELSADRISGGTLIVGGQNNENGTIIVKNANGTQVGSISNIGVSINAYNDNRIAMQMGRYQNGGAYLFGYGSSGSPTIEIDSQYGTLNLKDANGIRRVETSGDTGFFAIRDKNGANQITVHSDPDQANFGSQFDGPVAMSGPVTMNSTLDVTQRRCYASLSQEGWYRVCKTADISGTIIDFSIGRPYGSSPAEAHRISFYVVGGGKSAFLNETSDSNTLLVDKIRCINGGGFMYFDIHYTASSSNQVLVYFDVYGKGQENQTTVAEQLQSVADSPSGETVLTEYTFATNRRALLTTNIFRIRRTYSNITISSNNGYILLDSFENMGVSSQNYCLGFNIVGWSGFPTYGFQIMRGSNGTDFYLASSNAGTFGSFTVEYWFADLSV